MGTAPAALGPGSRGLWAKPNPVPPWMFGQKAAPAPTVKRRPSTLSDVAGQVTLEKNQDGSVNIHLGPTAPEGKEANWIPTAEGRRFFLLFRFYGPEEAVINKTFVLNDVELVQ